MSTNYVINSFVFIDGFDLYNTNVSATQDLGGITANWNCNYISEDSLPAGRYGGQCLRITPGGGIENTYRNFTPLTTLTVGCDLRCPSGFGSSAHSFYELFDAQGYPHIGLNVNADGSLSVMNAGRSGTAIGSTAAGVMSSNAWSYVELAVTISNTAGVVQLWVDGVQLLNLTNVDTQYNNGNVLVQQIALSEHNVVNDYDNMYVFAGITHYGPQQITAHLPISDDASSGWTPDSGSNLYSRVNDVPANADTTTMTSVNTAAGDQATFGFSTISDTPPSVTAVQLVSIAKKTDSGGRAVGHVIKDSSGNTAVGPDAALATGYTRQQTIFTTAPDGSAWSKDKVNTLKAGVKVTA